MDILIKETSFKQKRIEKKTNKENPTISRTRSILYVSRYPLNGFRNLLFNQ